MQFRRSGQRDDRRRRVLNDTLLDAERAGWSDTSSGSKAPADGESGWCQSSRYGDAAFMEEQPRLTDLIPVRLSALAGLLLVGLAVVAGLEVLYTWMPQVAELTSDGRVAALDLDGEGSLAVWFSSMTLAAAALAALLVFRVRQHRTDDYRGRYRIWLWAAMCWLVMSIDETASLHEGFKEMMSHVTGTRLLGDGSIWWVTAYVFVLGAVGTRLVVDMRDCRLSTTALMATAASYGVAVAAQLGWVLPDSGARGVMLEEGAEMVGNLLLLLAMGLHARHVILEAKGLLPQRKLRAGGAHGGPGESNEQQEDAFAASSRMVTVHPPHRAPRPANPFTAQPSAHQAAATADSADAPVRRKLTKAERKALRKRLKKMAIERERRKLAG